VEILVKTYYLEWISDDEKELVKVGIATIISAQPSLIEVLERNEQGKAILSEITQFEKTTENDSYEFNGDE